MNDVLLLKDIEDTNYVLGVLSLNGKNIDGTLFEKRVSDMFKELCWDDEEKEFNYDEYDAIAVVEEVLKRYPEYKGIAVANCKGDLFI